MTVRLLKLEINIFIVHSTCGLCERLDVNVSKTVLMHGPHEKEGEISLVGDEQVVFIVQQ